MLPGSIFATAGARAMGDAGRMPHGHKEVAGLQIAYVARDALTARHRSSCNKMLPPHGWGFNPLYTRILLSRDNEDGVLCTRSASGLHSDEKGH